MYRIDAPRLRVTPTSAPHQGDQAARRCCHDPAVRTDLTCSPSSCRREGASPPLGINANWRVTGGRRHAGFTLIEILVALAVFAVVAIIAYKGVERMSIVKQTLDADNRKWRDIAVAMARMEDDFRHAADRSYRDTGGTSQASFRGSAGPIDSDGAQIELVRLDNNRLVHLGYRLRNGTLELLLWDALDLGPRAEPTALPLLQHVRAFSSRYLDTNGQWQLAWPASATALQPPNGTEVTLVLESGETITRMFVLP